MKKTFIILISILLFTVYGSRSPVFAYYTNMPASVVIGQPDFVSSGANQNGNAAANTLSTPGMISSDGIHLFVVDEANNRVLIWNSIPTQNNQPADVVLGQSDFVSATANNGGISSSSLSDPEG